MELHWCTVEMARGYTVKTVSEVTDENSERIGLQGNSTAELIVIHGIIAG